MNDDDLQVPLTNREKKKKPKIKIHYCWCCDRSLVSAGNTCSKCGKRDLSKQSKKRDIKVYE